MTFKSKFIHDLTQGKVNFGASLKGISVLRYWGFVNNKEIDWKVNFGFDYKPFSTFTLKLFVKFEKVEIRQEIKVMKQNSEILIETKGMSNLKFNGKFTHGQGKELFEASLKGRSKILEYIGMVSLKK